MKRINIISNGQQAPYGIGEIMTSFPAAHFRKIHEYCNRYHNNPTLYDAESGDRIDFEYDYNAVSGRRFLIGLKVIEAGR